jgi:VIT1/CCC1 family predicted Fe2+/Mn2+ transporter
MEIWLYVFTLLFLMALGAISAKAGGANVYKAMIRVSVWGTIAMGLSALAGYIFGVNI